jgi:hypothetical protein
MTENDFDRTARLWLEDGPTILSDRTLQAALDEINVTRQRRSGWPVRRVFGMNPTLRFAIGAAAVVLVAVIGLNLLPGGSGIEGGPAANPTPAPTPTPTPIRLPPYDPPLVTRERGTYLAGDPFPIPVTITVPAGWEGKVGGPYAAFLDKEGDGRNGGAAIAFTLSQSIYADPCNDRGFLDPQPGPSVDDLASALANLPALDVTTPTEVTVDGYRGKQLTLTAPDNVDGCTLPSGEYRVWELPLGRIFRITPGQRMTLWILDVDGERLVVSADTFQATSTEELSEVQEILDSIRIESPG